MRRRRRHGTKAQGGTSAGELEKVSETEKGWMRVGFAMGEFGLREIIRGMENVLGGDGAR
jgi:hypothetical protein